MAKYLYGLAALLVLVVGGVLAAPALLDWSRHKPEVAALIERTTGHEAVIAGEISVSLVPVPSLEVRDVRVPSSIGPDHADLLRFASIRLELALLPLVSGRLESNSAVLLQPEFTLETLENGRTNWHSPPLPAEGTPPRAASGDPGRQAVDSFSEITLRHVQVRQGRIAYRDRRIGAGFAVAGIDADIYSESPSGPFRGQGRGTSAAAPVQFSFRLGTQREALRHLNAKLTFPDARVEAQVSGDVAAGGDPGFSGKLRLAGEDAAIIASLAGPHPWRWLADAAFNGRFALEGGVAATADALGLIDFQLDSDNNKASGSLAYRLDPKDASSAVTAALTLQRIDLDRWFAEKPAQEAVAPEKPVEPVDDGGEEPPTGWLALPAALEAEIDLVVEAIVLNRSVVRNVRGNMHLADGEITVNQVSAQLPGGTEAAAFGFVSLTGGAPRFDGYVEAGSDNLRAMLDWLAIDVSGVPTDRLRRWSMRSRLVADSTWFRMTELTTTLDLVTVSGNVEAKFGTRPTLALTLSGDRLDLDAYVRQGDPASRQEPSPAPQATETPAEVLDLPRRTLWQLPRLDAGGMDLSVAAKLDQVVYRGETLAAVEVEAGIENGALTVRKFKADDIAGSAVELTGALDNLDIAKANKAEFDLAVQRPQGFLSLFDLSVPPGRAGEGPIRAALRLIRKNGRTDWDIQGHMVLGAVRTVLKGSGAYEGDSKGHRLRLALEADEIDLGVLLATVSQPGPPRPAAVAPDAPGTPAEAEIDVRSGTPFSPDALSLPRATISLKVGRLTYVGDSLEAAELELKTEPGVAQMDRLQGRLFGGNLLVSGRISETAGKAISISANATLEGADAQSILPVEGLVTLSESVLGLRVALEGAGRSPRALLSSFKGEGRLWGEGGRIRGIDLAAANEKVAVRDRPVGLINVIAESSTGESRLSSFGGDFRLEDGTIQTRNLRILADGASGEISGGLDIVRRRLDAEFRLRFAALADAPPIYASVKGQIGAARVTVKFDELQTWLSEQKTVEKVTRE